MCWNPGDGCKRHCIAQGDQHCTPSIRGAKRHHAVQRDRRGTPESQDVMATARSPKGPTRCARNRWASTADKAQPEGTYTARAEPRGGSRRHRKAQRERHDAPGTRVWAVQETSHSPRDQHGVSETWRRVQATPHSPMGPIRRARNGEGRFQAAPRRPMRPTGCAWKPESPGENSQPIERRDRNPRKGEVQATPHDREAQMDRRDTRYPGTGAVDTAPLTGPTRRA